jgi:hypothetical protein
MRRTGLTLSQRADHVGVTVCERQQIQRPIVAEVHDGASRRASTFNQHRQGSEYDDA